MVHDLHSALEAAAARSPLAVVIDDLQWSDNGTLVALRSLPTCRAELPILWLFAARTGLQATRCDRMSDAGLERDGAIRVEIGALGPDAIAAIIGDVLRTGADDTLTALAFGRAAAIPSCSWSCSEGCGRRAGLRIVEGRAAVDGEVVVPRRLTARWPRPARGAPTGCTAVSSWCRRSYPSPAVRGPMSWRRCCGCHRRRW